MLVELSAARTPVLAVVFDLDGVIVGSEGLWDDVRRDLATEAGRPWPNTATADMMGMSSLEWSAYMHDRVGIGETPSAISRDVVARMVGRYDEHLPLITGAAQAVRRMGRRFPLGLASSSNREVIDAVMTASGLGEVFATTVSSEEVGAGKPAPDVYLEAASRLGVAPSACVSVEDSGNGIRSAAAAGMRVVAIPNPEFPPDREALLQASVRLRSIAELWPRVAERAS